MINKLFLIVFLIGFSSKIHSQVGYSTWSISYGLAYHGAYKVFDEGSRIGLTSNKYLWEFGINQTSKITLASSYYFNKMRLEGNYSFFDGLNISSGWVEPYSYLEVFTSDINVTSANFSLMAYKYNAQLNARFKLSPGIGFGIHKLDLFGGGQRVAAARFSELNNPDLYVFLDTFLDKFNYQLIGALEASARIGSRTYLFINSMYQLGFLKMYQRDIKYIESIAQVDPYNARILYNGNNYNFNLGLRWNFGDTIAANVIE